PCHTRVRIASRRMPSALLPYTPLFRSAFSQPGASPLLRDVWLSEIQVMAARDQGGTPDGFYLAAKGGNNHESHNHNDIGNFVVLDRKSTRLNSSHVKISYAVFCLKKKM